MKRNKEFLKLLIDKDMSKAELARGLGVSWQTVYNWSIGRNKPNAEIVNKVAESLGVSTDYIDKLFAKHN